MIPSELNLTIYQGANFREKYTWSYDGVPVDLTGAKLIAHLRDEAQSPVLVFELSTDNGYISLVNPTQGEFELAIPAQLTEQMNFDSCVFDLKAELNGFVRPLFAGVAVLIPSPTKYLNNV